MNILIVGNNTIWAIENYYNKHLNELGIFSSIFNCTDFYRPEHLFSKVLNRLGVKLLFANVNENLYTYCKEHKPDIVWVFKGVEIFPSTLLRLKELGITLFNYNPDHPVLRTAISHGGRSMEKSIGLYDAHFCYSEEWWLEIENQYDLPAFSLPFGFEPSPYHQKDISSAEDHLAICMIGNGDKIRARYVQELNKHGLTVHLFGHFWKRFLTSSTVCIFHPPVYGDRFWKTILDYRVQLNVFRPHNVGSHNMRTFEIPSVGGIQLAPYSPEHEHFFSEGKEIWMYNSAAEMVRKAMHLLEMSRDEILIFRAAAKMRCQREDYTYASRAKSVKRAFELMLNK